MSESLIWSQNSSQLDNGDNLDAIAQWWSQLVGQEVFWQQRLLPNNGDLGDLDWQPQKFDEKLVLKKPQVRGITLYWHHHQTQTERNITPSKLQLDMGQQRLDIFPQSQSQVIIRVSLAKVVYQKLNLVNPQVAATLKDGQGIILLRDEVEKLEVTVTLSQEQILQLLDKLKNVDN